MKWLLIFFSSQAGSVIIDIAYGIEVLSENDPYIRNAELALNSVGYAAAPGAFLVNTIGLLKYIPEWVPGAGFQKQARKWRVFSDAMLNEPIDAVKKALVGFIHS